MSCPSQYVTVQDTKQIQKLVYIFKVLQLSARRYLYTHLRCPYPTPRRASSEYLQHLKHSSDLSTS